MKRKTKTENVFRPVTVSRYRAPAAWMDGRRTAGTSPVLYGASAAAVGSLLWITEDNCGDFPPQKLLMGEMQNALACGRDGR